MRHHVAALDRRSLVALAIILAACFGVAFAGGAVTQSRIADWYEALRKPGFTPPNWVFGPVWSILYAMMAVAAWRAWRAQGGAPRALALRVFAGQLVLNLAWSFAFFGAESPLLGFGVILALEAAILWTMVLFARLDRLAAWLLAPYAAWVAYATALNAAILN